MIRDIFMRFPGGLERAVTLSYDDCPPDDKRFSDIISKYGLKCTFNYNVTLREIFSKEEAEKYVYSRGHEIAVHGENHRPNGVQKVIDGIRDVLNCRISLEEKYGRIIRGMAYPDSGITIFENNTKYEDVKRYLTDLGIVYSRTLGGDNNGFRIPGDFHAWMPTAHHNNPKLFEYIDEFLSVDYEKLGHPFRYPRLFYLWGHTYEFSVNDNWDLAEKFSEKLGNKENVWYATNIEIYDYVNAYYSLQYSANSKIVYNPSLYDIYIDVDSKLYKIASGETITID